MNRDLTRPTYPEVTARSALDFDGATRPHVIGRALRTDDGALQIAWPGTAVSVRFIGTELSVEMTDSGDNHYYVLVDGTPLPEKLVPHAGRKVLTLARGLSRAEHTVTLYRLNEPFIGTATIHRFLLIPPGQALPFKAPQKPRLEIVGDSISAGYGNEGTDGSTTFSTDTQNHFWTYGAIAARALGADLTTLAWSGKGVFTNRGSTTDTATMATLWDKTLPAEGIVYDFSATPPAAVLINLGTNDFAPEVEDTSPYGPAYDRLLDDIRRRYPSAWLLVLIGPLLDDQCPSGRKPLTFVRRTLRGLVHVRRRRGDTKIEILEFSPPTPDEGFGCDRHPSLKTHERMSESLVRFLRERVEF